MLANRMLMCMNKRKIDHSTPVTIVVSAYTTSATARPQILSNGWIVTMVQNGNTSIIFYVSKDNGSTWTLLTTWTISSDAGFSLCSYGNMIYAIAVNTAGTTVPFIKFDVTTVGTTITSSVNIDSAQYSFSTGCSIAISSTGILTAAWCSERNTLANDYNIRSAKSTNGGVTWTMQNGVAGVDQVTSNNTSYTGNITPYVQYDKNNNPIIVVVFSTSTQCSLNCFVWASGWNLHTIFSTTNTYIQSNPIATLQRYGANVGRVWCTWYGTDATDTSQNNIRASYSDDNGVSWSTAQKITNGNLIGMHNPSITSDINGNIYIMFTGATLTIGSRKLIKLLTFNGSTWSSVVDLTNNTTADMDNPSICDNYNNFTKPIAIWKDAQNTRVAFYGVFYV